MSLVVLPLSTIKVRERIRNREGDLAGLQDSISRLGLLQPLVVDADHHLVSGWRRLRALQSLGRTDVPVVVIDSLSDAVLHLCAERDENTCREEMNGFELTEITRRLLAIEKPKAQERQQAAGEHGKKGGRGKKGPVVNPSETVSQGLENGKALEKVAAAVNVSAPSLRKGLAAMDAYETNPAKYAAVKPALEAKQWGKAKRAVIEADDPSERPRDLTQREQLEAELVRLHKKLETLWNRYPRHRDLIVVSIADETQFFRAKRKVEKGVA